MRAQDDCCKLWVTHRLFPSHLATLYHGSYDSLHPFKRSSHVVDVCNACTSGMSKASQRTHTSTAGSRGSISRRRLARALQTGHCARRHRLRSGVKATEQRTRLSATPPAQPGLGATPLMASLFPRRRRRRDKRRRRPEGRDKRAAAQQTETRAPAA